MAPRYELAVGLKKGHKTTKISFVSKKSKVDKRHRIRPSRNKGVSTLFPLVLTNM